METKGCTRQSYVQQSSRREDESTRFRAQRTSIPYTSWGVLKIDPPGSTRFRCCLLLESSVGDTEQGPLAVKQVSTSSNRPGKACTRLETMGHLVSTTTPSGPSSPVLCTPFPAYSMTCSLVSLPEDPVLYHQQTTPTTNNTENELTQEGQFLKPPRRCKGWTCVGLGIEYFRPHACLIAVHMTALYIPLFPFLSSLLSVLNDC